MADSVHINGLRLQVRIGFHDYERHIRQAIRVDLVIRTDFRKGPARDQHAGLVDYFELTGRLQKLVDGRTWDLLEALAEDVAADVLAAHPGTSVKVRCTKAPLDMPHVESVAVEIERGGGAP